MSNIAPRSPRRLTRPQRRAVTPTVAADATAMSPSSSAVPFLASLAAGAKKAAVRTITRPAVAPTPAPALSTAATMTGMVPKKQRNPG